MTQFRKHETCYILMIPSRHSETCLTYSGLKMWYSPHKTMNICQITESTFIGNPEKSKY